MSTLPTVAQILTLPAAFDQAVTEDFIDDNGHMNIADYFRLTSWALWLRAGACGVDKDYIEQQHRSMFTVEHSIRYLGELRLGQPFSVHSAFVGRTEKAAHGVAFVVDRERMLVSCVLEALYVHVDMDDRRAVPITPDVARAFDADIAALGGDWLAAAADRLTLRREQPSGDGRMPS